MNTHTALLLLCFSCAALHGQPVDLQPVIAPEKDSLHPPFSAPMRSRH